MELETCVLSHGVIVKNEPIDRDLSLDINFCSDTFTDKHIGKHILFAGCSVTYGIGLPNFNKSWASLVHLAISQNETVSGFYNIAYPGHSISLQTSLILRYIEKYGKPDIIFFNLPSTSRTFSFAQDGLHTSQVTVNDESKYPGSVAVAEHYNYEAYLYLHQYCKALGIKLISITWSFASDIDSDPGVAEKLFRGKFDSFYKPELSIETFLEDYLNKNKGEHLLLGSDGQHPGYGPHAYYAYSALNAYYS
jgi:hypothetical protein